MDTDAATATATDTGAANDAATGTGAGTDADQVGTHFHPRHQSTLVLLLCPLLL